MLKSVLQNPQLRLAFKALVFGWLLELAKLSQFGLAALFFFLLVSAVLYIRPIFQTFHYIYPFSALVLVSVFLLSYLPLRYSLFGAAAAAVLFYLLLGIKNLVLIDRQRAHWLFHLGLSYLALLVFFVGIARQPDLFLYQFAGIFLVSFILFGSFLKGKSIWAWVPSYLLAQSLLVISFLPIGFLQSANLAFLIVWLLSDFIFRYRQKILGAKAVYNGLVIFSGLAILIFLMSWWSL